MYFIICIQIDINKNQTVLKCTMKLYSGQLRSADITFNALNLDCKRNKLHTALNMVNQGFGAVLKTSTSGWKLIKCWNTRSPNNKEHVLMTYSAKK